MGHSIISYTYDGSTTDYDLTFTLGYTSEATIAAYVEGDTPVALTFDFISTNRVRLTDTSVLSNGDTIVFTRTVSKTAIEVDLTAPGAATRESLMSNYLQLMYAYHELIDGRVGDVTDIDDAILQQIDDAVIAGIESFVFATQLTQDIVLREDLDGAVIADYTSKTRTFAAEDVQVYVENNPSVEIDVQVLSDGAVIYEFTVGATGLVTPSTAGEVSMQAGPLSLDVVGGNYTSGARIAVVIPTAEQLTVTTDPNVVDFSATYTTARTT